MADFTIVAPVPFEVEGASGVTYQLPRLKDLSAEQMASMGDVSDSEGVVERTKAIRAFLCSLCPGLADEPLTDMACMQLFTALAEGSGIELGES